MIFGRNLLVMRDAFSYLVFHLAAAAFIPEFSISDVHLGFFKFEPVTLRDCEGGLV